MVRLVQDKVQYSSLNDPDCLTEVDTGQGPAAFAPTGIVAEFPLHAARIVAVTAGGAFLVEDFLQNLVMKLCLALRGE
jgi:hypothetical protein